MDLNDRFTELAARAKEMGGELWSHPLYGCGDTGQTYYEVLGADKEPVFGESCSLDFEMASYLSAASPAIILATQQRMLEKEARISELERKLELATGNQTYSTLANDLQEFIYRCASQVPFEHASWANERGAALLGEVKRLVASKAEQD